MPRELVVILLPYCMTIVIGISVIVNRGIMTFSLINKYHSSGKGLYKTLILLSLRFSSTSFYHPVSLKIDFMVQGEVPVHSMKIYGGSVGIAPLILNMKMIGQPSAQAALPSGKEILVPTEYASGLFVVNVYVFYVLFITVIMYQKPE